MRKAKNKEQSRQKGNLGERKLGELRWQIKEVLLPPCPYFQLPSALFGFTLRISMGWHWQIRPTGVAGNHPPPCFACTSCMRLEGWLHLTHCFWQRWVWYSSTSSYRTTCGPLVHPQRSTQHVSEITWILHPSASVFPWCSSLLTKATQQLPNRKIY